VASTKLPADEAARNPAFFVRGGRMAGMPTLRRILKYAPAVVMGLLVLAWAASLPRVAGYSYARPADAFDWRISPGTVSLAWFSLQGKRQPSYGYHRYHGWERLDIRKAAGRFEAKSRSNPEYIHFHLPIPLILSLVLPLAVGPFISFRFRLWHYLAYTALVAVELAYYLRWQE
jgi:hypothetical protein